MGKLDDKIRNEVRKRRKAPRPVPSASSNRPSLKVTDGERNRFTQQNASVLLSLEKTIAAAFGEQPRLDDSCVAKAFKSMLLSKPVNEPLVQTLVEQLDAWRNRLDLADKEWTTAMRIILQSVETRSDLRPGQQTYLLYVRNFVKNARGF